MPLPDTPFALHANLWRVSLSVAQQFNISPTTMSWDSNPRAIDVPSSSSND